MASTNSNCNMLSSSDYDTSDDENECPIANTFTSSFLMEPVSLSANHPDAKFNQMCRVKVDVNEKIYTHEKNSPRWYYIDYSYEFIGRKSGKTKTTKDSYRHPANPFYNSSNPQDEYEGTIILKNEMTEKMIKFLLMTNEEIEKICGRRCPYQYKRQIMQSISLFW